MEKATRKRARHSKKGYRPDGRKQDTATKDHRAEEIPQRRWRPSEVQSGERRMESAEREHLKIRKERAAGAPKRESSWSAKNREQRSEKRGQRAECGMQKES